MFLNASSAGALSFQPVVAYSLTPPAAFSGTTPWGVSIALADFDGDGTPDIAAVETGAGLQVFLNPNGNGAFEQLPAQEVFGLGPIVAGDFNGDGKMDLTSASVNVITGNGDGTFNAPNTSNGYPTGYAFTAGSGPNSLVTGNFNGADKYDLAVADGGGASVTLLLQTAPAPPAASFTIMPGSLPAASFAFPYSETFAASGATGTVTFSLTSGPLPTGLTLTSGGVLSGTPTQAGSSPSPSRPPPQMARSNKTTR